MSSIHVRLAPPPRRVPLSLAIVNVFNVASQIAWGVFGFGMIFFWGFVMRADYSFFTDFGERVRATGTVVGVEDTDARVNKSRVMANHYEFSVAGRVFRGTSYASDHRVERGEAVTIEYLKSDPTRSRIEGMRPKMFGPGVAFVAIFPLAALAGIIAAAKYGGRMNAVLRDGAMVSVKATAAQPADPRLDRLAGLLNVPPEQMENFRQTRRVRSVVGEPAIQLSASQHPGVTAGLSPAQVDDNGDLRGNFIKAIRVLILPAIVIGFNTLPILSRLGIDWMATLISLLESVTSS